MAQRRYACIDDLTGVSNRRHIISYIDYLIEQKIPFHAVYLDLDHFKYINDTDGHERGDQVLRNVTKVWEEIDKKNAAIGRLGGDEFIAIVPKSECKTDAKEYAAKYLQAIKDYLKPDSKTAVMVTCSAGTASYPEDGKSVGDFGFSFSGAMYNAKNSGRNMVCQYDASFEESILREQYIEARVRDALENKKFFMAYQPQYDSYTHGLRGFEALIH